MAPQKRDGTELIERATPCHDAAMSTTASETLLNHWIGGRRDERAAERHGEVTDPATGEVVARVPFATTEDVDRTVQAAATGGAGVGRGVAHEARPGDVRVPRARQRPQGRARRPDHARARQGAVRRARRGHARARGVEFACGLGQLLKGENTPQVSGGVDSHSMRMPLGVVAGITPFNFPVMVPLWMAPSRSPAATPSSSSRPSRTPPPASASPSCSPRPACPTACSASSTATARRSTPSSPTPASRPSASSARRRSRATSTRPARRTASACRRSAARRTTR